MDTITVKSNTGRFDYEITAEINLDVFALCAPYKEQEEAKDAAERAEITAHNAGVAKFRNDVRAIENVLKQGLANIGFRALASNVSKALVKAKTPTEAVYDKHNVCKWPGGKATAKTPRNAFVFSPEACDVITEAARVKLEELQQAEGLLPMTFRITGEHSFAEDDGETSKEAKELWAKVRTLPQEKQELSLDRLGIEDKTDTEACEKACHLWLLTQKRELKAEADRKTASALGL